MPSSRKMPIDATPDAHASGWPLYVSPPAKGLSRDPVAELLVDDHRPEGHVAGVDALRHREDVRHDLPVLAGEPLAGAAEAGHHLVEDQHDAVPVAHLADRLQVAVGRRDHAVRTRDRLHDHGRHVLGPLVLKDLLEVRRAAADRARVGVSRRAAVRCTGRTSAARLGSGLGGPAARVAGERDPAGGRAVVRAIARDHLVPPGVPARELDRVLVRLGAAVREERHREVAGVTSAQQAREGRARLRRHRRPDRARPCRPVP